MVTKIRSGKLKRLNSFVPGYFFLLSCPQCFSFINHKLLNSQGKGKSARLQQCMVIPHHNNTSAKKWTTNKRLISHLLARTRSLERQLLHMKKSLKQHLRFLGSNDRAKRKSFCFSFFCDGNKLVFSPPLKTTPQKNRTATTIPHLGIISTTKYVCALPPSAVCVGHYQEERDQTSWITHVR